MKCDRARKLLALGVGKDLDVRAQASFDEHVAGCLSCFREVTAFRRSRAALKTVRPHPDRTELDALAASILARVDAGEAGPVGRSSAGGFFFTLGASILRGSTAPDSRSVRYASLVSW